MKGIPSREECINAMLDAGIKQSVIDKEIKLATDNLSSLVAPELIPVITAKKLHVNIQVPVIYMSVGGKENAFMSISNILLNGSTGTYINTKGRILKAYQNESANGDEYISLDVIDKSLKNHIRINLYDDAFSKFKKSKFSIGDRIKFKNFHIKKLDKMTILESKKYSEFVRLK